MLKTIRFILNHPLGSLNRIEALARFAKWQVGSRVLGKPVVMPFVNQTVLVVESSMTGATGNVYCGLHEFEDMGFCLHFLRNSDTFLDVGANIGSYTVLASGVVGAKSISIEPVPSTFRHLERNIRCNGIEHLVDALACVAGRTRGHIRFSTDRDTTNQVVDDSYKGMSESIPVMLLDEILCDSLPTLWKVDVEGFEEEVIAGGMESLQKPSLKAVLLELDSGQLQHVMFDAGFRRANYDPFLRKVCVIESKQAKSCGSNNLWVRDVDFVNQRCSMATEVTVNGITF